MSLFSVLKQGPLKVALLGAGNWGSAIAVVVGETTKDSYLFSDNVSWWVREEIVNGQPLSKIIKETHVNVKYLPDIIIPSNVAVETNIEKVVADADLIVVVLPHQFVLSVAKSIQGKIKKTARGITLTKGLHIENNRPRVFSDVLEEILGIEFYSLSGANIAKDVANKEFSETTLGFTEREVAALWQQLFDRPYFRVRGVPDVRGVQLCGAIKNIIALAAGFADGLGRNCNAKSAVIRTGVEEMKLFCGIFFDGILEETFFDSSGFADVVTTCFGGRNVRCAAEFVRRPGTSWEKIEDEILGGQKMQGNLTCEEVYRVLTSCKLLDRFPLFHVSYRIAYLGAPAEDLFNVLSTIEHPLLRKRECREISREKTRPIIPCRDLADSP